MNFSPIAPRQVRYIKLGGGGDWEKECLERKIIRFGFGAANSARFSICITGRWSDLIESLMIEDGYKKGTATNIANQTRSFFEDDGTTLWITFIREHLYWGFLDASPPKPHEDGKGVWRKVVGGWRSTDINKEALTKDRLSGALTKLEGFRGTSCKVDVADYVVHRINGIKPPEVELAFTALDQLTASIPPLLRSWIPTTSRRLLA